VVEADPTVKERPRRWRTSVSAGQGPGRVSEKLRRHLWVLELRHGEGQGVVISHPFPPLLLLVEDDGDIDGSS
jgi:hypothetical protein